MRQEDITPELLIRAYRAGLFPMAEDRLDPEIFWLDPDFRGILPLQSFTVPRSLRRHIRRGAFTVSIDAAFGDVMAGCAAPAKGRQTTWISERIQRLFMQVFQRGSAHSVEVWHGSELVGGTYGVAIGGAYFGESMFHRATNASKVALVYLVARLKAGGFTLFDTQFTNPHLEQFGVLEIPKSEYRSRLETALAQRSADFYRLPVSAGAAEVLQLMTQTS